MRTNSPVRLIALIGLAMASANALGTEPHQEYRKRIESSQNLTALQGDLFGENVSLFNGQTSFSVTDIDLPGNNALPVQLRRSMSIDLKPTDGSGYEDTLGGAGGWDIDVPYMSGMFGSGANDWKWDRCSGSTVPMPWPGFDLFDVWQGNTIHLPGQGSRAMLAAAADTPRPSDGISRRWTTASRDAIDCIPMQTGSGLAGQGFRIRTTAGITYHFDKAVLRQAGAMKRRANLDSAWVTYDFVVERTKVFVLATRVEDRFGNWVQYQYSGNGNPERIWSSDGREIVLGYANGHLATAQAAGKTWSYTYGLVEGDTRLSSVVRPDLSTWNYSYSNNLQPDYWIDEFQQNSTCTQRLQFITAGFVLTITHPSGAVGAFTLANRRHGRSGVHASECMVRIVPNGNRYATYHYLAKPNFFDVMSLQSKVITGPGLPSQTWSYSYGGGLPTLWGDQSVKAEYPCTLASCSTEKSATVVEPDGAKTVYRYGYLYALNEGRLLGSTRYGADGTALRTDASVYLTNAEAEIQSFPTTFGGTIGGEDPSTAEVRPITLSTVQLGQDMFTTQVKKGCIAAAQYCFDTFGRPLAEIKASSLGYSKTDTTAYYDNLDLWVLGQVSSRAVNGLEVERTEFTAANALPWKLYGFDELKQTLTYNLTAGSQNGTLATVTDGRGLTTTISQYKGGVAQHIKHADATVRSAVVDDAGLIASTTDEAGARTCYTHDEMGRIESVTLPSEADDGVCDSTVWNATTQIFEQVPTAEHGIDGGHWRQTVTTGRAQKISYYDGFWRPLLVREFDMDREASTSRFTRYAYDHAGRAIFASYPGAAAALTTGVWTEYDALGRKTSVSQDSELGLLTTRTDYLSGFRTRVTDASNNSTLTSFMAFDQPVYELPVLIDAPEGQRTRIARDAFGKPMSVTRGPQN